MGGQLSCLRMPEKGEEEEERKAKPSQYDEIDDNFTILPTDNKDKTKNKSTSRPKNDDVTNKGDTYENVSNSSQNNLRNYVPNNTRNNDPVSEIQNVLYTSTAQVVTTYSSQPQGDDSANSKEILYENCTVTSQHRHQSSSSEIQDGADNSTNQNPENDVGTASGDVNGKNDKGSKKKAKVPPPIKPKKSLFKIKDDPPESTKESSKKDGSLTYIEVEFATPPSDANKNGATRPSAKPSTTYTDVVHEGGRLVLIR